MTMQPLLQINQVSKRYPNGVLALNQLSLSLAEGEVLGLVGESGSGKSTLARLVLGLERPDQGEILLNGALFHTLTGGALRAQRRHVQAVFQDPTASLNPRLRVWQSVVEPLENYPDVAPAFLSQIRRSPRAMAAALLERVGLSGDLLERFPHQLSGGQRQRVAIARGLSLQPKLLVCDEPTSSLDVSVQAQILNLLKQLRRELGIAFLFISHDIASVRFMSDRIAVLKGGLLVDQFPADALLSPERHAYTRQMVEAVTCGCHPPSA